MRYTLLLILFIASANLFADPPGEAKQPGIVSHIRHRAVGSTALASVGYSKRLHALEVEFVNGAVYRYLDVAPDVYRDLIAAPSKARFYDENIRGRYSSLHVRSLRGRPGD